MIIIAKDSMRLEFFEDGQTKSIKIDHDVNSITKYMDHIVFIEKGVTIRDIFVHLSKDEENIDIVFDSALGGHSLSIFLKEAFDESKPDDLLHHAVFEHKCNMDTDELLHEIRFTVIGKHPQKDIMVPYSVELSAINAFVDLEVEIDTRFAIKVTESIEGKDIEMNLFSAHKPMTLYEVLSSLLYEVSYHGTPTMRKKVFDSMKTKVLAKMSKDGDISAAIVSATIEEDILEMEQQLEKTISVEDYETSATLRDKINNLKRQTKNK